MNFFWFLVHDCINKLIKNFVTDLFSVKLKSLYSVLVVRVYKVEQFQGHVSGNDACLKRNMVSMFLTKLVNNRSLDMKMGF